MSARVCGERIDLVMDEKIKILIVDDNAVGRSLMSKAVADMTDAEVAATAPNGKIALAKLKQMPVDMVFLDVEMPEMNGLETLGRIQRSHPDVGVVMISASSSSQADNVIEALEMGALDFVARQGSVSDEIASQEFKQRLVTLVGMFQTLRNVRKAKLLTQDRPAATEASQPVEPKVVEKPGKKEEKPSAEIAESPKEEPIVRPVPAKIEVVAIGVSTGGPNALTALLPKLPADLGVPVVMVQHMPKDLTGSLAHSLDKRSPLSVREAVEGEEIQPNVIYIAPGGKHMVIRREKDAASPIIRRYVGLNTDPPENSCRPSVDVLFRSVAKAYGGHILAIVMTGMGSDGLKGVQIMKQNACYCLTQTEGTCVVYGMPRAVDEANLSDESIPLDSLADRIATIAAGAGG